MKRFFKKNWKILLILAFAILFRLKMSLMAAHSDLRIQSEWGKWMYLNGGLKGLYDWNVWGCIWPNHPPLMSWLYFLAYRLHSSLMFLFSSMGNFIALNRLAPTKFIWFFDFIKWFGQARYENTEFLMGTIVVIKQYMILADIFIAGVIYHICKKNNINWKKFVLLYLLLPFSWYLSSIWGQSDQLSFLFLLIAFLLLTSTKYSVLSPLIFAIAANFKPNCALLVPIFLFIWFKQKQTFKKLFIGGLIAVIFSLWTVSWYTNSNPLFFSINILAKRLSTGEGLVTLNAFNFWYMLFPFPQRVVFETTKYIGLTAKYWGYVFLVITTILATKVVKYKKVETVFGAMFIAGFGSWLFMTGMHERYSFFAIMALLIYSIYKKQYLKYFIILSTIYFLGMFYVYAFIPKLEIIKELFAWNVQTIPRLLSIINLLIYGRVIYLMLKEKKSNEK